MKTVLTIVGAGLLALFTAAVPAAASDSENCDQDSNLDLKVVGCSSLLNHLRLPPELRSLILSNRGSAYKGKGEYRKAIADYSLAIRLNPKDDSAYNNRSQCGR